jgi:hypothetical protein
MRHRDRTFFSVQTDMALGRAEKEEAAQELAHKALRRLSAEAHLAVPRGPLIFMSQRGRTTVRAIESFFVGFFRSAPRINPLATGDENRRSQ